jgi:hypothetical protein
MATIYLFFQVVQSSTSPVTCSTTAVKSNFKYGYHVFGQQEATFSNVDMQGDMVLIARFYLRKRQDVAVEEVILQDQQQDVTLYDEETLVAWTAIPLVLSTEGDKIICSLVFIVRLLLETRGIDLY